MTRKFAAGDRLDEFELIEKLPSGGMASIWRARKDGYDGPVIVKAPFLAAGEDVSTIIGYEVERMIASRLSGPHVPKFFGFGDLAETPYIAMEFVEGVSLEKLMEEAPFPYEQIRETGLKIATALVSLHADKVAHLDLKPDNIILAKRGAVFIDFGLARHAELPDLLGEESSMPMGTAAYISPEQVLGERDDPASDIFAVGCIMYQMATGNEPFGSPQTTAGMRRRLFHSPPDISKTNPAIPRWMKQVIANCMEVDRTRRYRDAAQLVHDLRHPDQVTLREAETLEAPKGWLRRLLAGRKPQEAVHRLRPRAERGGASIIVAAVFLTGGEDELAEQIRAETARLLAARADSRLACVTVWKTELIGQQAEIDKEGNSIYVKHLVALKDWARPLRLDDTRLSYHVLEAVSAADAILDFAGRNHAGHIVMGARGSSAMRRHLGSVSAKVVSEARCSVTVIRVMKEEEAAMNGDAETT
jgi:nucleotide-binding universal stress UspA family protein